MAANFPGPGALADAGGFGGTASTGTSGTGGASSVGSVGGASAAVGPQSSPGSTTELCQQLTIESGRITPDMLIVLDRSSSMKGEGVDRWTPSVSGLKAVTGELDKSIRFGLMAFPGRGTDTLLGGGQQCAPGTLEVPIALGAASAIGARLDALALVQTTPTALTLEEAHKVLGSGAATLDMASAAKFVILVTDGAPNCTNGGLGGRGGDAAAVAGSVAAIAAMKADGIKTYVLGYGTQSDPTLKAALDQMAKAGGTGDTVHRAIEDEASLVTEFRRITGGAASCEYALTTAPSDPNFVSVRLDGEKLALNAADGFTLSADRKRLTVSGSACAKLQSQTGTHALTIRVECERQTLL